MNRLNIQSAIVMMLGMILIAYGLTSSAITGMVTGTTSVTVLSASSISMVTSTVAFGDMAINTWNDTADDKPAPFKVRNDGTINLNVSINASDLWTTSANPSGNYTAMCGDTGEWSCSAGSITTYTEVTDDVTNTVFISDLSWLDTEDEAELDVNITCPPEETSGSRSSTITFTGSAA